MIGRENLIGCQPRLINFANGLDAWATSKGLTLICTSGKRNNPTVKSWHNEGLAIDFCFKDCTIFKVVSELFAAFIANNGIWAGVTEFEVCRGVIDGEWREHLHAAIGTERSKEWFTGTYK